MSAPRDIDTPLGPVRGFHDDLISDHLERFGEWAPFETRLAAELLRDEADALVLDAGAFVGTFGLELLHSGACARVLAVEGNAETYGALAHNAHTLAPGTLTPVLGALGLPEGASLRQVVDPTNRGGARFSDEAVEEEGASGVGGPVTSLILSDLRSEHGAYALAKFDLEGCELRALKSEQGFLHAARPALLIEASDTPQTIQIGNYCRWLGYHLFYADLPVWRRDNPKDADTPIFHLAHEGALVAASEETLARLEASEAARELRAAGGRLVPAMRPEDLIDALWHTPRWSNAHWAALSREALIAELGKLGKWKSRAVYAAALRPDTPFGPDET